MQTNKSSTKKNSKNRRRYYVDPQVQGALLRLTIMHWAWTSFTFALVIFIFRLVPVWLSGNPDSGPQLSHYLAPYLIASLALFPMIFVSTIRFSNRFVGPIVRVRQVLSDITQGKKPTVVKFRDGDYWCDVARDLDAVVKKLNLSCQPDSEESPVNSDSNKLVGAPIDAISLNSLDASQTS